VRERYQGGVSKTSSRSTPPPRITGGSGKRVRKPNTDKTKLPTLGKESERVLRRAKKKKNVDDRGELFCGGAQHHLRQKRKKKTSGTAGEKEVLSGRLI